MQNNTHRKILGLRDVNEQVKNALHGSFPLSLWVSAEISELKTNAAGHCYLELVEKNDKEFLTGKAQATIWSYTFRMLRPYFESTTGQTLKAGLKVLVNVTIEFHEIYGFSLNIKDIDPAYTIGDLAQKKAAIIQQLIEEGIIEMNKDLPLPFVIQNIAVVSSETAAGYEDFINHLNHNEFGYRFKVTLFPAVVQGQYAENSIINAIENIYNSNQPFDIVVIIRGGGSQLDLECFNNYNLPYLITQFPIPVLTGIGHEKDDTITDLVAHTKLKTPTAVAGFILNRNLAFEENLNNLQTQFVATIEDILDNCKMINATLKLRIHQVASSKLHKEDKSLILLSHRISRGSTHFTNKAQQHNDFLKNLVNSLIHFKLGMLNRDFISINNQIKKVVKRFINEKNKALQNFHEKNELLDPFFILKRGYSLTFLEGKLLKSVNQAKDGRLLTTHLYDGKIISKTTEIIHPEKQ